MIITILDGSMQGRLGEMSAFVEKAEAGLQPKHTVRCFHLQNLNIRHCNGCWDCWWKTPGICAIKDDMESIYSAVMQSDLLVFASPLMSGFTSSLLKKASDRLIPLIHPYVLLNQGECHHKKRYDKYPDFALILEREPDTDDEDIIIVKDIYRRFALNFHCSLKHTWLTHINSPQDIAHDINHF